MANVNAPFGLRPHKYLNGAPWTGQARMYCIPSSDGTAYAIGDPVTLAGSADANGVPTVVIATPGSGLIGPIVGMGGTKYGSHSGDPANLNLTVIPATKTKAYYVLVMDDPDVLCTVQEITGGTPFAVTDVGLNANLVAGTNNGYISQWGVSNSTEATTATLDVQLMELLQVPNNAIGDSARWVVRINSSRYKAGVAGV